MFILGNPAFRTQSKCCVALFDVTNALSFVIEGEEFIGYIEENDLEDELSKMCEDQWAEIEEAMVPERKRKF